MGRTVCHRDPFLGGCLRFAVTGAGGFVGRHLLRALLARKIVPTITYCAHDAVTRDFPQCPAVQIDMASAPANIWERLGSPDVLIHLAWAGLPNYRSIHHFETELPTQYRFLKHMLQAGLKHLVVTGTCFEYGMQEGCLTEDIPPRPTNPYGFAKNALREQLTYLQNELPFTLSWARLFYLYGEGQSEKSLFSMLHQAVGRGQTQFDMSGGEQLRDFLPIEEAAQKITALALLHKQTGPVNICSGIPISIRDLVEGWIRQNGWNLKLNFGALPYPDYEPMAFWGGSSIQIPPLEGA